MSLPNQDLVSIIMAAYNAESYIAKTIQSVIDQSYQNWELIIIDDRSKDNTIVKVEEFKDPRIQLIVLKENVGTGVTRNAGLKVAQGQYVSFIDSDDVWLPYKLEQQLKFMKEMKAPICHTSYSFIDEGDREIKGYVRASESVSLDKYMRNTEIGLSTAIIDRKLVGEFSFNPMRLRQDTRLWIDLMMRGFCSHGLDKPLVRYRIRKGQISGNKFRSAVRTFKLYLEIDELPLVSRLMNFVCYLLNAILKRLKSDRSMLAQFR